MDKDKRIEQIIETNLRLNALHTRELGAEMRRRMEEQSEMFQMGLKEQSEIFEASLRKLSGQVETSFKNLGGSFEDGMNAQADRMEHVIDAIRTLGDGSTDIRKEIDELKRRVQDLEDRAS